jgi:chemotaxis protein methyltransferase CheR
MTPEVTITDQEFELLRRLIHSHAGIALAPWKRDVVRARLGRRLQELGIATFAEYHTKLLADVGGTELMRFINAMTTNKTEFFREAHHFDYLRGIWLPSRGPCRRATDRRLRFWSAACSTGEEPYSLAITLLEALDGGTGWDLRILASDIDTDVLAHAADAIYPMEQVAPVPRAMLPRYFLKGTGGRDGTVRVKPAVRSLVTFRRINFLEDPWPIRTRFDVIFCRNVLIYFDRPTQQRILHRLVHQLTDTGLLFLGHAESVHGLVSGLTPVAATVYRRDDQATAASAPPTAASAPPTAASAPPSSSAAPRR